MNHWWDFDALWDLDSSWSLWCILFYNWLCLALPGSAKYMVSYVGFLIAFTKSFDFWLKLVLPSIYLSKKNYYAILLCSVHSWLKIQESLLDIQTNRQTRKTTTKSLSLIECSAVRAQHFCIALYCSALLVLAVLS